MPIYPPTSFSNTIVPLKHLPAVLSLFDELRIMWRWVELLELYIISSCVGHAVLILYYFLILCIMFTWWCHPRSEHTRITFRFRLKMYLIQRFFIIKEFYKVNYFDLCILFVIFFNTIECTYLFDFPILILLVCTWIVIEVLGFCPMVKIAFFLTPFDLVSNKTCLWYGY